MPDVQKNSQPKHLGSFWPIFIIIIVSMVAGAVIYAFAYGNMLQDEANSISFWPQKMVVNSQAKLPAKPVSKTTTVKK
jgi:hypothetical protein